jgi:hypothetical protein
MSFKWNPSRVPVAPKAYDVLIDKGLTTHEKTMRRRAITPLAGKTLAACDFESSTF